MIAMLTRSAWHLCAALLLAFSIVAAPDASAQPTSANTAGRWSATFQWDGAEPGNGVFVLNSDGTFSMEDYEYTGRWNVRGDSFWLRIEQPPNSVYSGAFLSDGSISGTLRNNEGRTGTFTFTRAGASASGDGYLPQNFDPAIARRALAGDNSALLSAFVFEGTPQGHAYWYSLYESHDPLPAEAQAQLREWIARAEAQNGGSSGGKGGASSSGDWHAIAGSWELTQNLRGNTCSRYYRFDDRGSYLDWFTGENAGQLGRQTDASNFRDVGGGRIFYNGYDDQYFQIVGGELVRTNAGGARYCTFHRTR